jgi:hypothetical protein
MAHRRTTAQPPSAMAEETSWHRYVASRPSWRPYEVCPQVCLAALVCGRARVCADAHKRERALVYALARLSAQVGERPPGPASSEI